MRFPYGHEGIVYDYFLISQPAPQRRTTLMTILPTLLMASTLISALSLGKPLPSLKGEFLTGRQAQLPDSASGRVALLALGFTCDSRFPVEAWIGWFRKEFGG